MGKFWAYLSIWWVEVSISGGYGPENMIPDSHTLFMWYSKLGASKNGYSMVRVPKTKTMGVKSRKGTFFENHHLTLLYLHRRRGGWGGQCFPKWPWQHSKTDVEQAKEHHWQREYIQTIINQKNWKLIHSNIRCARHWISRRAQRLHTSLRWTGKQDCHKYEQESTQSFITSDNIYNIHINELLNKL